MNKHGVNINFSLYVLSLQVIHEHIFKDICILIILINKYISMVKKSNIRQIIIYLWILVFYVYLHITTGIM